MIIVSFIYEYYFDYILIVFNHSLISLLKPMDEGF